ncbi:aconitate hydratase [Listeria cornellensis FSL F6-0969]|uniref:Aconitate hydratase n=1 Tax=Listeria cornellensis FSL F6-0969 TaxID=1265820 RepID=W7BVV5_9LIST|nr:aconitate hydratase [Listeria cornellensis FSL F6-0969]
MKNWNEKAKQSFQIGDDTYHYYQLKTLEADGQTSIKKTALLDPRTT